MKEDHPHIRFFDVNRKWRYLIIGTFPPNSALRTKMYIDYFYGNKGFLWKIIHDLYNHRGYDFFKGSMQENLAEIKRWQNDYCVGLSDTILSCSRKTPLSSDDADLTDIKYNFPLKEYVLNNSDLKKIIFTSSYGKNSAYENFKLIMGSALEHISDKLVIGLPSPSGSANITFFNTNKEETLGLTKEFYDYIVKCRPNLVDEFKKRWELKKQKREATGNLKQKIVIPSTPPGLVKEYKLWKYKESLPEEKCR